MNENEIRNIFEYVLATIGPGGRRVDADRDPIWTSVHVGRLDSSIRLLEKLRSELLKSENEAKTASD